MELSRTPLSVDPRWDVIAYAIPVPVDGRLGATLADDVVTMACAGHRAMITAFVSDHCYTAGLRVDDRIHRLNGLALFGREWNEVDAGRVASG